MNNYHLFIANGPIYAFQQSDTIGRIIVCVLFFTSIVAWTIIIDKYLYLKELNEFNKSILAQYEKVGILAFLNKDNAKKHLGNVVEITRQGLAESMKMTLSELSVHLNTKTLKKCIKANEFDVIKTKAQSSVDGELILLEKNIGLLSSIVSASPFLGLLGTVWGIMMSFTGMAIAGKADINAIAPGVSGALLTTVVGLLVAIPAVIGYNALINQVRISSVFMDNYTERMLSEIKALVVTDD
ncbi:MAG: MotA/TolQ/ExbB proton channel family protein [Lentisphaeria bacterium]|nr:MotA/TolQ/ExbB proton channel family protein [Lentisphaeria bacterium]NQZ71322.1 MotA/TolQ/ExbB proton channel family protein [Lentisphaeria bacterium]